MNWNGDYHTNYNYEAAVLRRRCPPTTSRRWSAYDQPVLDYQSAAQTLASQNGFTGVLYPVGISPKGTSADTSLHNQKSNAADLASDMVMHFEYTDDTSYANTVYPWLKQVGAVLAELPDRGLRRHLRHHQRRTRMRTRPTRRPTAACRSAWCTCCSRA